MTREQAKKLLPAITHFANGGELWCVDTLGEWRQQTGVTCRILRAENIIKDKHFEVRKHSALGGEVETDTGNTGVWKPAKSIITDVNAIHYRPKEVTQSRAKTFITFGGDHLPNYDINSMSVMLLIEDRPTLMADEELEIGRAFAFEYSLSHAKEMTEKWGMKLYTKEELLEFKNVE